jgi:hypothetical protein
MLLEMELCAGEMKDAEGEVGRWPEEEKRKILEKNGTWS